MTRVQGSHERDEKKPSLWQIAWAEISKVLIESTAPSSTLTIGLSLMISTELTEIVKVKRPLKCLSSSGGAP